MTATDELRRLLDERGVEWRERVWGGKHSVTTFWHARGVRWRYRENRFGELRLHADGLSPEQAIDATLGRGTCRLDGYTDAAFRVVQAPDDTDFIDYAGVCECSACGASVIVPHEYERVTAGSDELWPKFNYCPNCGRRVIDPTANAEVGA